MNQKVAFLKVFLMGGVMMLLKTFLMVFLTVLLIRKYEGAPAKVLPVLGPIDGHYYSLTWRIEMYE